MGAALSGLFWHRPSQIIRSREERPALQSALREDGRDYRVFRPKIFLFENVKGLLSSKWTSEGNKGEIWRDVWTRFHIIEGYTVHWQLVSAKDYGVPQNRPRVLLLGIRDDVMMSALDICKPELEEQAYDVGAAVKCGFLPEPTKSYPHPKELLGDLVDNDVAKILSTGDFKDFSTSIIPCASTKLRNNCELHRGAGRRLKRVPKLPNSNTAR